MVRVHVRVCITRGEESNASGGIFGFLTRARRTSAATTNDGPA